MSLAGGVKGCVGDESDVRTDIQDKCNISILNALEFHDPIFLFSVYHFSDCLRFGRIPKVDNELMSE